ncbi:hypothetical protein LTR78_008984 [Recurvomyces mirabilis]|uniref:Uncharacterized protein n=1 Tax=Recurvomyces mirabilis TaxID=574656 RepID=A0AAE0WIU3_9PEZI|nr:hypothetical protein LTR78_008984 [Recurvomyces mirabilis]KAK5159784.1 hypothetical protein LTS14_001889 [Recurvomyces mirabilis]
MSASSPWPEPTPHIAALAYEFVEHLCGSQTPISTDPAREFSQFYRQKYHHARYGDGNTPGLEHDFGYKHFPFESACSVPRCPKTCETCSQHYRSIELQKWRGLGYHQTYSDAQAAELVHELIHPTQNDLAHVRAKLQLHGDAIAKRWPKRWRKRTVDPRAALLLKAKPDIYKHRWVEAELLCQSTRNISDQDLVKDHKLWLLPDLDLPGLSETPGRLLALVRARTACHPAQWVPYDSEQLHFPFDEGLALLAYILHCVVMQDQVDTFGTIVPWKKGAAHRWDIIGLLRALLVLEAQNELSTFRRSTVDLLLQAPAAEGNSDWQICAARGFMDSSYTVTGPWVDQFSIAPPVVNFATVVAAMRDRLQVAKDDLYIPNPKRLTSHGAADMRVAHESLAGFWKSFRKDKRKLLKRSGASKEGIREVVEMISYDKSAEHGLRIDEACTALDEAFAKQESKRNVRDNGRKRRPQDIVANGHMLLLPPTATLPMLKIERLTLAEPKQKIKTRRSDSAAIVPILDISMQEEHHPKIEISAASLALLQRMFTPIACSKATADIKWNEFNSAVVDAGCTFKYGGGSSVTYTFRGATGDGCVMVHRPHPDPTIDPIMLGSFGKNFAVSLGWEGESFVLRRKGVEK